MQPADAAVTQLQRQAEEAYALCAVVPDQARDLALAILEHADDDPLAAVLAQRALGLALRRLVGPTAGIRVLRDAIKRAQRHQLVRPLALVRMTYAALLADVGRIDAALDECDIAATVLRGVDAGPLLSQRALILSRAGRSEEALVDYGRALPLLRAAGDIGFQCRLYMNRANVLAYLGRIAAAERDLRAGIAIADAHGLPEFKAMVADNLGFVMMRKGDIPAALQIFGESMSDREGLYHRFTTICDRAEALLSVGLATEARRSLEQAIDDVATAGFAVDLAEWHLMLAHAALTEGDAAAAKGFARTARTAFRNQNRPRWALLALHLEIRARWAEGERTNALAGAARDAHARLSAAGWQVAALHCLLAAGRVELERGRLHRARTDFAQASQARRRGPSDLRAAAWYGEALLRTASNDGRGALTALKAGLRVVDEHAASLGATDLRVHASGLGADLAAHGVRLAIEANNPAAVLDWVERYRAGALRRRPVRPPSDAKLAAELAELRRVTAELAEATAAGRDSRALRAAQLRLEETVRTRSRHAKGSRTKTATFDRDAVVAELADRALVEIFRFDDALRAVTVVDGRLQMTVLGDYADALREQESLRFSLHRLARRHGSAGSLAAAQRALDHAAANLDTMLLAPLAGVVDDRELVIVPTGVLHALPWPTLPSLRGRPVSVGPSATSWLAAARVGRSPRIAGSTSRVVFVAGPGLEHGAAEVRAAARLYRSPLQLTGAKATANALTQAMDGAQLVHVAAHGRFRADNPQFSALDMADGPLTVYDLERIRRGPRRLILSACDSGLSAVHPGDELMGLVGAVFSLGTATLIASVVPVADDATKSLMVELHRELCAGQAAAHALATAQERVRADGFVCFGAG